MRGALLLLVVACGPKELPVTGGFRENVVDRRIKHGQQLDAVDIDDDGNIDIVSAFSLTDAVHVYLRKPDGTFDPISISGAGSIVALDTVALDVDGDSDLDVAAVGLSQRRLFSFAAGEVVWYENPGDPRGQWVTHPISRPNLSDTSSKSADLPWGACCIDKGDLDGDGIDDLVVGLRSAQDEFGNFFGNRVDWYRNEGNRIFTGPHPIDLDVQSTAVVLVTDVDRDGRLDVMAGADVGQEVAWYHNEGPVQGNLRFVKYTIWDEGAVHGLVMANMDADADDELVVSAYAMTTSVSIAYFDRPAALADPWTRTEIGFGFGSRTQDRPKVAVADFDGDGMQDVAVSSPLGDLRVYRRNGATFEKRDVRGGYRGLTGLSSADVDLDGRVDLVTSTFEFGSRDRVSWWRNESF